MAPPNPARSLVAPHALLPQGWAAQVLLAWDAAGTLVEVTPGATAGGAMPRAPGVVLPGMPNLHSHAFQRAFAGLTEVRADGEDSFWRWREHMYRFAAGLTPDLLEDIATQLYVEMLRAGYTSVCEFHYVHHDRDGRPYATRAEMALRLSAAARRAGIGLTLLPVLYQASGFGGAPARPEQRRFVDTVEGVLHLVEDLRGLAECVGLAPHSLRAVPPAALREAIAGLDRIDPRAPIHLHIAEQQREVDDCLAWSGRRPLRWLLDELPLDGRWCLVHATHADAGELRAIAAAGATVGLCPTTEANLGDGIFPAADYLATGGAWGIGSDSHASVDVAEELRLLEYGQRLLRQRRNVLASAARPDVAERLWLDAVAGGARASGRPIGGLAVGQRADFLVLDSGSAWQGLDAGQVLASHVFAHHGERALREVWVGGERRVADGEHPLARESQRRFVAARAQLLDGV
ncbi:MAG TPA: formimidoylglutamate deiminase [Albitalea sp.]|nr:formimidoylglutamate deiminase [Albitalea sp.]